MDNAKTLKIVRGISQAAANAFDGALDKDGKPVKIGLRREKGHVINQSRTMDGFKVRVNANKLILTYQSEIKLKDVHDPRFENNERNRMNDIVNWLKNEYKNVTGGDSLSLKVDREPVVQVQHLSNIRAWIIVTCVYTINGMDVATSSPYESKSGYQDFNKLGGWNK